MSNNDNPQQTSTVNDLFGRLRGASNVCAHNHQSPAEILRRLHVGPIERFLLWLAKTDYYVLSLSTYHTRLTLASLGMMVLFTSILAFSSSLYALLTTLVPPDSALRWPLAILLATLYAFGIMIIDREIVGSISRKSLIIRIFFAIFIALAVSWPVKLKFFEGRTMVEINRMIEEANADKLRKIEELEKSVEPGRKRQIAELEKRMAEYDEKIKLLGEEARKESNDVERGKLCGPRCKEYLRLRDEELAKREAAEKELAALSTPTLPAEIKAEITRLRNEIEAERKISYDFLTKWEALSRIKKQSGEEYTIISTFLMIFFMLLEMIPLALKWSIGKTEYHYYLEARTNLNNQKIISLTNLFIDAMQKDKYAVLSLIPVEITDLIAMHMEDEAQATSTQPVDIKALTDALREIVENGQGRDRPSGIRPGTTAQPVDTGDPVDDDATVDEPPPRN